MRNRTDIINFLKGLKDGTRSIRELEAPDLDTYVFMQIDKSTYEGDNGKSYTEEEIKALTGHVVIITNPHLQ